MMEGFAITRFGEGFHVAFPCGYTLSVQFADGNYCEHYIGKQYPTPTEKPPRSRDAEMAIVPTNGNGPWIRFPQSHDDVLPFASVRAFGRMVAILHAADGVTAAARHEQIQQMVNEAFPESKDDA